MNQRPFLSTRSRLLAISLASLAMLRGSGPSAFAVGEKLEAAFKLYDKNGDGVVTREEAGGAAWFDALDEDKDGSITPEEALRNIGKIIAARAAQDRPAPAPVKPDETLKE